MFHLLIWIGIYGLFRQIQSYHFVYFVLCYSQAFHGIAADVIGIAAGKTKVPTPLQSPDRDCENPLEEPKHLNISV